jgi:hypothetical protein
MEKLVWLAFGSQIVGSTDEIYNQIIGMTIFKD